jgi:DNA topoisomerase-1
VAKVVKQELRGACEALLPTSRSSSKFSHGRDARGRRQYRYHARFRQVRDSAKFHRMLAFAESLPIIRAGAGEPPQRLNPLYYQQYAAILRLKDRDKGEARSRLAASSVALLDPSLKVVFSSLSARSWHF